MFDVSEGDDNSRECTTKPIFEYDKEVGRIEKGELEAQRAYCSGCMFIWNFFIVKYIKQN